MTDEEMTTPSPAPWSARGRVAIEPFGPVTHWYIRDKSGNMIARVFYEKEDAAMMAAAPDMYEALKDAKKFLARQRDRREGWGVYRELLTKINAALAKAKGDDDEQP